MVWLRAFAVHSDWPAKDGTLLRDVIRLRRGLNVLWAKPAPPGTKNRLSGHATGKTTFCRLVRYLLCDADAGTKDFRQRFQSQFPRGWVFGEVVIGNDEWLVGRSLSQLGYHHFAKRGATLADAVGPHPLRGGFDEYEAALETAAFERVKLRKLSGTNRDLKWDCLIQWLARDQEARFAGLLDWRNRTDSDSESPDLSAADKENLVRIVLGLVEKDEQKLLRDHAKKAGEHTKLVNQRPSLVYHAEQQRKALNVLAKQDVAKPNEPLLREAIKTTVAEWRANAEKEKAKVRDMDKEEKLEAVVRNAEAQLLILQPQLKSAGVSQTWSEIHKVNEAVRQRLQACKMIGSEERNVVSLERLDLTDAQKGEPRYYNAETVLVFNRNCGRFRKGESAQLVAITGKGLIAESAEKAATVAMRQLDHVTVCRKREMALAPGDRLQLKVNAQRR